LIDEVLLFNRALSSQEVSALYNATANQYYNNFTNLAYATHNFTAYSVNSSGAMNQTEQRSIRIAQDIINPKSD
jgi:hypothetical protein